MHVYCRCAYGYCLAGLLVVLASIVILSSRLSGLHLSSALGPDHMTPLVAIGGGSVVSDGLLSALQMRIRRGQAVDLLQALGTGRAKAGMRTSCSKKGVERAPFVFSFSLLNSTRCRTEERWSAYHEQTTS